MNKTGMLQKWTYSVLQSEQRLVLWKQLLSTHSKYGELTLVATAYGLDKEFVSASAANPPNVYPFKIWGANPGCHSIWVR